MSLTTAARQKKYREKRKTTHKRLDILLSNDVFNMLHDNAKELGLTQAAFIESLLLRGQQTEPEAEPRIPKMFKAPPLHSDGLTVKQSIELHLHHSITRSKRALEAIVNEFNNQQGLAINLSDKEPTSLRKWLACLHGTKQKAIIKAHVMS